MICDTNTHRVRLLSGPVFEEFEDYHPPYTYEVHCLRCGQVGHHPAWQLSHECRP